MERNPHPDLFSRRLDALHRRVRRRALGLGLLRWSTVALPAVALALWVLGGAGEPGGAAQVGLNLSLLLGLAALAGRWIVLPLIGLRRPVDLVRAIERGGGYANLLISAEEARREPERWSGPGAIAGELRRRLQERAAGLLEDLDPARVVRCERSRTLVAVLAGSIVALALYAALAPEQLARGWHRLLEPIPTAPIVPTGGLYAVAGDGFVVAGEDHVIEALDFGGGQEPTWCEVRIGSGGWQRLQPRMEWLPSQDVGLPAPGRVWRGTLEAVQEDFAWRFRRGERVTVENPVRVRRHPLLTRLGAVVRPPAYTGLPEQTLHRLPAWIEVPAGSRIELIGEVNHPVLRADLVLAQAEPQPLERNGATLGGGFDGTGDASFHILLEDEFGLRNLAPVRYEIEAAPDAVPLVRLERPDDDGILPIEGDLLLRVEAADDYGLASLALQVRAVSAEGGRYGDPSAGESDAADESGWSGGAFWRPGTGSDSGWMDIATGVGDLAVRSTDEVSDQPEGVRRFGLTVRLDRLELVPGDALELRVEGRDNRRPGPAGVGRSRVLRLALPSAAEVLAEQAEAAQERRSDLEEMRRRQRQLGADLDRLSRELMKNPVPDWARQQEMEAALRRQRALQEELAKIAENVRAELDRLAESQLTSGQMLDKADEIASLLDPSLSESLQDLMQQLEEGAGQLDPQEVADAIEEITKDQTDLARRLDAALAMMDRMAREQELEGMTALLEKMMRTQQELAEESRRQADAAQQQEQAGDESAENGGQEGEAQEQDPSASPQDGTEAGQQQEGQQQEGQQGESGEQGDPDQSGESGESGSDEPTDPQELARRQEALAQELEQLQEKMQQALDQLAEQKQGESGEQQDAGREQYEQALQQAMEQLQEQMQKNSMKQAAEELAQMDPQQAAEMQQQALRDLGALYHVLMKSQQAMQMAMQAQQLASLRALAADLLTISERQELIAGRIPLQLREVRSQDLTRGEHRLQKATAVVRDGLAELMDDSPQQVMALLEKMDSLIEEMGRCVVAMNENRGSQARRHADASLGQANSLVINLLTQAQMAGQGQGSGSPQQSLSEQLQQLAREQAGLNGLTEQIRQMLANRGLSQEVRSQMKRLGELQGELGAQARELERQERMQPEGERILGDLGELGRQMERVGAELDDGLVSEETLLRQERILGRLLDARNSVRRRDYTQRRESRSADELYARQEGREAREGEGEDAGRRLRFQPLNKAPLEYRELVRRYFSAVDSLLHAGPSAGQEGTLP